MKPLVLLVLVVMICSLLDPSPAQAQTIDMYGTYYFRQVGPLVYFGVDYIQSYRSSLSWSGTLVLQIWACFGPYDGTSRLGYKLAEKELGQLWGGRYWYNVDAVAPFYAPPPGTYHIVFVLAEWQGYDYQPVDWENYPYVYTYGTVTPPPAPVLHTVNVSCSPNGRTNPSGNVSVSHRAELTITATPDPGHEIGQWFVDGFRVQSGGATLVVPRVVNALLVHVTFTMSHGQWFMHTRHTGTRQTAFGFAGVIPVTADFDGDGTTDIACYYPPTGEWYGFRSSLGYWTAPFGFDGTVPITGDFDGDRIDDFGCYYAPFGGWFIFQSQKGPWSTHFGYHGTVPVTGDFDGDGRDDIGCYHAPGGDWYLYMSSAGFSHMQFGYDGTVPVVADFDNDRTDDIGCYDDQIGGWFMWTSSKGFMALQFGYAGTVPVIGDYDGDSCDDIGCYHADTGSWHLFGSSDGYATRQFGFPGTTPVNGDFDGDGFSDIACFY